MDFGLAAAGGSGGVAEKQWRQSNHTNAGHAISVAVRNSGAATAGPGILEELLQPNLQNPRSGPKPQLLQCRRCSGPA